MKQAFLFAGQGSQKVGMGVELAGWCDICRDTLKEADESLGYPLSKIMAEGPESRLQQTAVTQPAVLTLSVAHARYLLASGVQPDALVGHSLGQYSALVMANAISFADALRLVSQRGELMQETVPEGVGGMTAIIGLDDRAFIYRACELAADQGIINVACHNAPGQTVISGAVKALDTVGEICEEEIATVVSLAVSAPFHCQLLIPMLPTFKQLVDQITIQAPSLPVIDNVTAQPATTADAVRRSLVDQITSPVLFEESIQLLSNRGLQNVIQCGPGNSLLSFVKRIDRKVKRETFDDVVARLQSKE